jgi:hypothetical protein
MARFAVLVVLLLALVGSAPVAAQDASPAASPVASPAAACVHPALPPGTPTPMEASPEAGTAGMAGTPEAVAQAEGVAETAEAEAGSPEAAATPARPEGTPADQATIDRLTALYESAYACLNGGDYLGFAALYTPEGLLEEFGTANPYDLPAIIEGFGAVPEFRLVSVDAVLELPDGRLYAEVTYRFGNALAREGAYYAERDGELLADAGTVELPVEVPAGAQTAEGELVDFAFNVSQTSFAAGVPIAFNVVNTGQYPHELAVVQLPEGATVEQLLQDPALQEQMRFVGATFAEPGQAAPPLVLLDLEPGTYTMVCFVDVPEGMPHVARGMVAEFTVA